MNTRLFFVGSVLLCVSSAVLAGAGVPMMDQPYSLDLGTHSNTGPEFLVVPPQVVTWRGVHWIRVQLKDVSLGTKSYIVLRSVLDGQVQTLDGPTLADWAQVSAAFHGDSVELELHVAPGESDI